MSTRRLKKFRWKSTSCNKKYFDTLTHVLNHVKIPDNTGNYIRPRLKTQKAKYCKDITIKDCKLDKFHSGNNYLQIILGRLNITLNCFYKCKNYYPILLNKWSVFKNDTLLYHILHNSYFYKRYSKLPLDPIFPIRVVLSDTDAITSHKMRQSNNFVKDYGYNIKKGKAISNRMIKIIKNKYPTITKKITKSSIISRELCLLTHMKIYKYVAKHNTTNIYQPYIFISEHPISFIKNKFKDKDYIFEYL